MEWPARISNHWELGHAVRNEVLIMNFTALATMLAESFNRRAGMRSKPTAFADFSLRSWDITNSSEISRKLNGGFWRVGVLESRWLWPQVISKMAINLLASDAKNLLNALAMHCFSEETTPSTLINGEVAFFSPKRISSPSSKTICDHHHFPRWAVYCKTLSLILMVFD